MTLTKTTKLQANRLLVRKEGILTLHLNSERLDVHLDDRAGLTRLQHICDSAGELGLMQNLKEFIDLVSYPPPQTLEEWQAELARVDQSCENVITAVKTGKTSREDSESMMAINDYRLKRLESIKLRLLT